MTCALPRSPPPALADFDALADFGQNRFAGRRADDGMKQPIADALNQRLGHLWRPGLHRTLQLGRDESKGLKGELFLPCFVLRVF